MDIVPAARSLSIITSLRLARSTIAPANGLNKTVGPNAKNPINASAVTSPVSCQAKIVSAKRVIPVPIRETNWPLQMIVKAGMPVGRRPLSAARMEVV